MDYRTGFGFHLIVASVVTCSAFGKLPIANAAEADNANLVQFMEAHCFDCHGAGSEEGGLAIDTLLDARIPANTKPWEAIVCKLTTRQMPPPDAARPDESEYNNVIAHVVAVLDRNAAEHPNPGPAETFRRLNRTEYQNAVRDLLDLDIDVSQVLPGDEASHGFDNITVTGLSPVLLDRYVSAAQKISRLAVGVRAEAAAEKTYRVRPDVTQDTHIAGTPIGTRGGTVIRHHFPQDGEYEIQAWLMRDRNEELEGLRGRHQLEILLDDDRVELFQIGRPPRGSSDKSVDANLKAQVKVSAGPHEVGVVFLKKPSSLLESVRQPLNVHFNYYRHPRIGPAVYQFTIRGPFDGTSAGNTPSRRCKIFVCYPTDKNDETACAERILLNLMGRAYRRQVTRADLKIPMTFFHEGMAQLGFDAGVERALSAILVSPHFLFRIERTPPDVAAGTVYPLPPLELAARLFLFLWSSIPDDELRKVAIEGGLQRADVLEAQVKRMLADERSRSLIQNFGAQWLYLRNLASVIPDMRLFPDFDDNLRQALRRETELFFAEIVREDRSVLDLIKADFTYLNERLAKHYGIPHVYGSQFRRVKLDAESRRGGLLRHGSILTVTSYATRTSPVIRGNWDQITWAIPPPPPPPNVPALKKTRCPRHCRFENDSRNIVRTRHVRNVTNLIDPIGFALENYDALGRWRETESGEPIQAAGRLADGTEFVGVAGLEQALLKRPEMFVQTLTEKMMTFALGRGLEYYDAPAVRRIVREAKQKNFRFSEIVLGIAKSVPFQMRKSP